MNGQAGRRETSKVIDLPSPILGKTRLELVGHARIQMKVRGIDTSDILTTLSKPDRTDLPTQAGRKRYRRSRVGGGMEVDVVFEELPDRIRVITAIAIERRLINRRKPK